MAWLNATPQPPEGSKRAKLGKTAKRTRAEQLKKDCLPRPMPPNPLPVVIDRLVEIGMSEAAGMGVGPISWQTIDAWQRRTSIDLPPWEARLLRVLSIEYVAESRKAEAADCPPPWRAPVTQRERDLDEERLRMVLG